MIKASLQVKSHNILYDSQIGFLPKNRTADHALTLRTYTGQCLPHGKHVVHNELKTKHCRWLVMSSSDSFL